MTARSVVLSVLLGAHPAWATAAELLRLTSDFGIREPTLRVALTRMVSGGDLVRSDDGYRLSGRLLERQRRQDDALNPTTRDWDGRWITAVVTTVGTDARTRAALRTALQDNRFGELREGVWLRPDNLDAELHAIALGRVRVLRTRDHNPADLAHQLWDLPAWSKTGHRLLGQMNAVDTIPGRFTVAAEMVRHLLTDPVLPAGLLPADWPGHRVRAAYAEFVDLLTSRRDDELLKAR
ncbi:MAG: PaaX family transcriptional regulator C-terminal domain-containing protein [Actinomycetes bacterium]